MRYFGKQTIKMKYRSKYKKRFILGQVILALGLSLILFLALFFLGLPLLAKLSLVFDKIRGGGETIILVDHAPPFPPQLESPFTATNSARITIQGISEPNSIVKLFQNNQELEKILVGKDGAFTKRITLKKEKNKIVAKAIDQAGNESAFSTALLILYKKDEPLLEIDFPPDEDFQTEEEEIEITGKADPEVNLNINNRFVFVKNDGSFSHLVSLSEGENLIEIVTTDQAGNQTKAERKVTYSPND